jgi:hypothetical protein
MMHGPINVKSPNNISKWQMGFNSAFKGLKQSGKYESYASASSFLHYDRTIRSCLSHATQNKIEYSFKITGLTACNTEEAF